MIQPKISKNSNVLRCLQQLYFSIILLFLCLTSYSSSFVLQRQRKLKSKNPSRFYYCNNKRHDNNNNKFIHYYNPKLQIKFPSSSSLLLSSNNNNNVVDLEKLKEDLKEYMQVREEKLRSGTYVRKQQKGKVVGGTRGNVILDWVSASPNKEIIIEEERNIFDYEELMEFGYTRLVSPIMDAGGRKEIYKLMNMTTPSLPERLKPKKVRKIVIDRAGDTDKARYKGLKMTQALNDDEMALALENANKKKKEIDNSSTTTTKTKTLRPKLQEEMYEIPFADKRNVGPKWTPNWTAEQLDEEGKRRGKAISWAKNAKEGMYDTDPYEELRIEKELRIYAIFASILTTIAFGKSTSTFLTTMLSVVDDNNAQQLIELFEYPALVVILAAFGSCGVNWFAARQKKRSGFVWAVKGFMGGPLSIIQLRNLDDLQQLSSE